MRMLLGGYIKGTRSERRVCEGVHLKLAYRRFFKLDLNDTDNAVILDVEPTRSIRQVDVDAVKTMIDRVQEVHDLKPERLIADTALAPFWIGWFKNEEMHHIFQ